MSAALLTTARSHTPVRVIRTAEKSMIAIVSAIVLNQKLQADFAKLAFCLRAVDNGVGLG
jgi:hypothetical protein